MTGSVSLTVNGRPIESPVEARTHLADFVRDTLRLTGTHLGCEHGVCGACTVLVDGMPIRSCIAYAIACEGADVRTIEGFDHDPLMQMLRDSFTRRHALQCGYCTPGMLIVAYDVVRRLPDADETRVREELAGNLCRCTGYVGIVAAVTEVLKDARALEDGAIDSADGVVSETAPDMIERPARDVRGARVGRPDGAGGHTGREESLQTSLPVSGDERRRSGSSDAVTEHLPSTRAEGQVFTHEIAVPAAPEQLWSALNDVELVVHCLPGATLRGPVDDDPLSLEITVAIGPIRARFEGAAHVVFDDRSRTGRLEGRGHDTRTRSSSEGSVEFSVLTSPAGGSVLILTVRYTTRGLLAQFSRGAVIDAAVEQILERFAANLVAAASGREVGASPPIRGLGLVVAAVRKWLRERSN